MTAFLQVEDLHKTYILKRKRFALQDDDEDDEELGDPRQSDVFENDSADSDEAAPMDDSETPLREVKALRGISFEANPGDVIGFVGDRGAGKSTLLDIIARKTLPTRGRVSGQGLLVSINDLQRPLSGFFNCRRNLLMAAAMLGLQRKEVEPLIEEAASLSGAQKYLDVAASKTRKSLYEQLGGIFGLLLRPDILIADETSLLLARQKLSDFVTVWKDFVENNENIVLIASNRLATVSNYTNRCLWLNAGELVMCGDTSEVVAAYQDARDGPQTHLTGPETESQMASPQEMLASVSLLNQQVGRASPATYRLAVATGHWEQVPVQDNPSQLAPSSDADEVDLNEPEEMTEVNLPLGNLGWLLAVSLNTAHRRGVRQIAAGEDLTIELIVQANQPEILIGAVGSLSMSFGYDAEAADFIGENDILRAVTPARVAPEVAGVFALQTTLPGDLTRQAAKPILCRAELVVTAHSPDHGGVSHSAATSAYWMIRGDLNIIRQDVTGAHIAENQGRFVLQPEFHWKFTKVEDFPMSGDNNKFPNTESVQKAHKRITK